MNYLIVCPNFPDSQLNYYTFPIGIAYINSSLKQVSDNVFQLNLNFKNNIYDSLRLKILECKIDCLVVGGTSLMYNHINEILNFSKEINPNLTTIVGGGLITASPMLAMEGLTAADIGIIGEGEYTIQELVSAIEKRLDFNSIKGIVYRTKEEKLHKTESRSDIENLDLLPFPDYDGFEYECMLSNDYRSDDEALINFGSTFFGGGVICTSRSCPYQCTFCFHTCGQKYRQRSLDNIFEEIDMLVAKYNIKYLNILDELFGLDKKRVKEFCQRIKPYNIIWRASTRVDGASTELYQMMREAGCLLIGFGIESANNQILKSLRKNITFEQIQNAFQIAKSVGVATTGCLLLGDKNETMDTFKDTIDYYRQSESIDLVWSRIIILPGSELYNYAVDQGIIKNELEYWRQGFPFVNVTKMTDSEYDQCTNIMEEITARRSFVPKIYNVIDVDNKLKSVKMVIQCNNCEMDYKVTTQEMMGDNVFTHNCPNCGQFHNVQIYRLMFEQLQTALEIYLENNKLYIYGVGHAIRKFILLNPLIHHENIIIVDKDPRKQENGVGGKKILPIHTLSYWKPNKIINGATMPIHIQSINDTLKNEFPWINETVTINEFLFDLLFKSDLKV